MSFIYDITDTWNDAETIFNGIKLTVTESERNDASSIFKFHRVSEPGVDLGETLCMLNFETFLVNHYSDNDVLCSSFSVKQNLVDDGAFGTFKFEGVDTSSNGFSQVSINADPELGIILSHESSTLSLAGGDTTLTGNNVAVNSGTTQFLTMQVAQTLSDSSEEKGIACRLDDGYFAPDYLGDPCNMKLGSETLPWSELHVDGLTVTPTLFQAYNSNEGTGFRYVFSGGEFQFYDSANTAWTHVFGFSDGQLDIYTTTVSMVAGQASMILDGTSWIVGEGFLYDKGIAFDFTTGVFSPQAGGATKVGDLGSATLPWRNLWLKPGSSLTPTVNGTMTIQATSNTQLTFKLKGSDGTVRSGNLTLS